MSKKPTRPAPGAGRTRTSRVPAVPRPSVPRPRPGGAGGVGRGLAGPRNSPISSLGALAVVGVMLLAGVGYGYATRGDAQTPVDHKAVRQLPLSSATGVCQGMFIGANDAFPEISAFTPGTATLGPNDGMTAGYADNQPLPSLVPKAPGTRTGTGALNPHVLTDGGLIGLSRPVPVVVQAKGVSAPGFGAGIMLHSDTAKPRGLAATQCTSPATDFWFSGVSLGTERDSKLELTNIDGTPATVNLQFFGPDGQVETALTAQNLVVQPHSSREDTLSGFLAAAPGAGMAAAVHVTTSSGRVAAAVLDELKGDAKSDKGMDFIPAQSPTAPDQAVQVIPGVPAGGPAGKLPVFDLTLTATGSTAVTLDKLEWADKSTITVSPPAQQNTNNGYTALALPLTIPAGKTITVDLSWLPVDGQDAGTLRLSSSGGSLLSGVRVAAAAPANTVGDIAYLAPAQPITAQSVVVDNKTVGAATSTLYLTSLGSKGGTVTVTTVGGDGKASDPDTVQIPAGSTVAYPLKGVNEYSTVIQVQPGSDPVYGSRQMSDAPKGIVTTTLQVLEPARLTVDVPPVAVDLSGAVDK